MRWNRMMVAEMEHLLPHQVASLVVKDISRKCGISSKKGLFSSMEVTPLATAVAEENLSQNQHGGKEHAEPVASASQREPSYSRREIECNDDDNNNNNNNNNKRKQYLSTKRTRTTNRTIAIDEHPLVLALRRIDPILQFLTKATGLTAVPISMLQRALPTGYNDPNSVLNDLHSLSHVGVLHLQCSNEPEGADATRTTRLEFSWEDTGVTIGFPLPVVVSDGATSTESHDENAVAWNEIRDKVGSIHGSTKTAAKKRLKALQLFLKFKSSNGPETTQPIAEQRNDNVFKDDEQQEKTKCQSPKRVTPHKEWARLEEEEEHAIGRTTPPIRAVLENQEAYFMTTPETTQGSALDNKDASAIHGPENDTMDRAAWTAFCNLMGFPLDIHTTTIKEDSKQKAVENQKQGLGMPLSSMVPCQILPRQLSYAGSEPAQCSVYSDLSGSTASRIPAALWNAFNLRKGLSNSSCNSKNESSETGSQGRCLYEHQVRAIESAISRKHTTVCTGTGSGKSLCFLLPVLTNAYHCNTNSLSIILFPTKALAQDQYQKLMGIVDNNPNLRDRIRISTLDGDCSHAQRSQIVKFNPNILLTNPDTLHAALLPNWKTTYKALFVNKTLAYVVLDEAHLYEGVFGSHVALILARLLRVAAVSGDDRRRDNDYKRTTFFASSATMPFPLEHFCRLFPIDGQNDPVTVVEEDSSPRAAKHFFTWNPPLMTTQGGQQLLRVTFPRGKQDGPGNKSKKQKVSNDTKLQEETNSNECLQPAMMEDQCTACAPLHPLDAEPSTLGTKRSRHSRASLYRRHAADESALLFVRAIQQGTRCIAFAKTRNLVEWIYEKALNALGSKSDLRFKIESYRGGYSRTERRKIEERLFSNDLLGVVATNALELGVDIGGVDLTLHCGYPSSLASLYQQAGRAGRGSNVERASCSVVVCFNSPLEQYLWKQPQSLLAKGLASSNTIPLPTNLIQGHLLCASEEFPLAGSRPVTEVRDACPLDDESIFDSDDKGIPDVMLCDHDLFGGEDLYEEALEALKSTASVCAISHAVGGALNNIITIYKAHPSMKKPWSRVSIRSIEPINYAIVNVAHPRQAGRMDAIVDEDAILDSIPFSRVFWHCHPGAIISHRGTKYKIASMTRPPAYATETQYYRRSQNLAAFARPTNARYTTRPLSTMQITVIKQIERVDFPRNEAKGADGNTDRISNGVDDEAMAARSFAGCGAVSVKRTVHGYKKLSLINRSEIGRTEISLPDLEFDTFGLWIDTDAGVLHPLLGERYGEGVHAFSHALLAVAPLYAPGLVRSDLECDHSTFSPTRIVLFDERAGGNGATARLWKHFFRTNNLIEAALLLLESCPSCGWDTSYDGGCPACLHAPECLKFNMQLSRKTAIIIGKHMQDRVQQTQLYQHNVALTKVETTGKESGSPVPLSLTPRTRDRQRALRRAKELRPASDRQFVVGRPTWPFEEPGEKRTQEKE